MTADSAFEAYLAELSAVTATGVDPLDQIRVVLGVEGYIETITIAPAALADHTCDELADLITDVLRDGTHRLLDAMATVMNAYASHDYIDSPPGLTVTERSADRELSVEVDWTGHARVDVGPDVLRSWSAEVLADRVMRLHRLASMRARAEKRAEIMQSDAPLLDLTTPSVSWPAMRDVSQYRQSVDF